MEDLRGFRWGKSVQLGEAFHQWLRDFTVGVISCYLYIYIYIWVNCNDLTATSLESWLIREIIPKWP